MASEVQVALYGRTYLDAEIEVDLATLASGKGKVDTPVTVRHGGFAFNAARALAGLFADGAVRVVTVASKHDRPRLESALPDGIALDAILTSELALPPVSVIINPSRDCRILRDRHEHDAVHWRIDRVPRAALGANLHIAGRLPPAFVAAILKKARAGGARVAWVGGHSIAPQLERELDLICVNSREAVRLVGREGTPKELAEALVARARPNDAVRVVTGAGQSATAAAFRDGGAVRFAEATPAPVPREKIATLLGVGDAFASRFLTAACFDGRRGPRRRLAVAPALRAAQRAAGQFLTAKARA